LRPSGAASSRPGRRISLLSNAFILTEEEITMKFLSIVFAVSLLSQAGTVALAQTSHGQMSAEHKMGDIKVTSAWARASAKMARAGAAYVTLENAGGTPDTLLSASAPVADKVELHTHIKDGDIMKMREVESIEVGPHAKVALKPGGLHVMLIGLKKPLEKGSRFPLTLDFEKAGKMTVEVTVEGPGAMGPDGGQGAHGGMKH
jgi:copper(I)-binding protein